MEIACTDEVKVYKDEGEEDEQKKLSENLTEDKVGLVIEGEGQCPPKNAFNFGFLSLRDYYQSLLPLPFAKGASFSGSASPYAVAAAAAAATAAAAAAASARQSFPTPPMFRESWESHATTLLSQPPNVRIPVTPSSRNAASTTTLKPTTQPSYSSSSSSSSELTNQLRTGSFAFSPRVRVTEPHLSPTQSPFLPTLSSLHPSLSALMASPLYDAALQAAAVSAASSPGTTASFWPGTESAPANAFDAHSIGSANMDVVRAKSSPSVAAVAAAAAALSQSPSPSAAAAFHSELLRAANLYGFKTTSAKLHTTQLLDPSQPSLARHGAFTPTSFATPLNSPSIPTLDNWTDLALKSSPAVCSLTKGSAYGEVDINGEFGRTRRENEELIAAAAAAAMWRGCLSNPVGSCANGLAATATSLSGRSSFTTTSLPPPSSIPHTSVPCLTDVRPKDDSLTSSPLHSALMTDCSAAAAAAHVHILSSLAAVAVVQAPSPPSTKRHSDPSSPLPHQRSQEHLATAAYESSLNRPASPNTELQTQAIDQTTLAGRSGENSWMGNGVDFHLTCPITAATNTTTISTNATVINPADHRVPFTCSTLCSTVFTPSPMNTYSNARLKRDSPNPDATKSTNTLSTSSTVVGRADKPSNAVHAHDSAVRDPGTKRVHIKKPLNAFMLFMKEMRPRVQQECTLKESAAINQILGRKWHELPRDRQAKYYEMARKEKELHHQLFPGWSARDNYAMHSRRKKKRRLACMIAGQSAHRSTLLKCGPDSALPGGGGGAGRLLSDSGDEAAQSLFSSATNMGGELGSAKKCRARFGLEHQHRWCKPCRRKKKCIRFMTDAEFEESERQSSTSPQSAQANIPVITSNRGTSQTEHSTIKQYPQHLISAITNKTPSEPRCSRPAAQPEQQLFPGSDAELWSCYVPNLQSGSSKSGDSPPSFSIPTGVLVRATSGQSQSKNTTLPIRSNLFPSVSTSHYHDTVGLLQTHASELSSEELSLTSRLSVLHPTAAMLSDEPPINAFSMRSMPISTSLTESGNTTTDSSSHLGPSVSFTAGNCR